jgi:hypothetical protein
MLRHAIVISVVVAATAAAVAACGGSQKSSSGASGPAKSPGVVTAIIEGEPARFVVRVTRGEESKVLVDEPAPGDRFDSVTADVQEVKGTGGRVFLAQKLGEVGEDEFTREIEAWVIDAARDQVLWSGRGSYGNSFGECESLDVPEPSFENGVLIVRIVKGVEKLEPETDRCEAVPIQRTEAARVELR